MKLVKDTLKNAVIVIEILSYATNMNLLAFHVVTT